MSVVVKWTIAVGAVVLPFAGLLIEGGPEAHRLAGSWLMICGLALALRTLREHER